MNLQTVKPDHRIHREWIHTVLSYAESALDTTDMILYKSNFLHFSFNLFTSFFWKYS